MFRNSRVFPQGSGPAVSPQTRNRIDNKPDNAAASAFESADVPVEQDKDDNSRVATIEVDGPNDTAHTEGNTSDKSRVPAAESQRRAKEAQMNKTTTIMFAVTVVFILSWIPPWTTSYFLSRSRSAGVGPQAAVAILFCRRSFLVNTCTNPLFYIGMSSAFRRRTQHTMAKLCRRLLAKVGIQ